MSRITLAREYPDDRDVIAQICKLKSRTSATEKETSQIEQHLTETDGRVTQLEEVTAGLDPGDIQTVKEVADTVQLHTTQIATLDGETEELMQDVETLQQDVTALDQGKQPVGNYVTTDTEQTITRKKTFTQAVKVSGGSYSAQYGVNAGNGDAVISKGNTAVISASENGCFIYSPTDRQGTRAATLDWIWNVSANADNNLVHRTATETIDGTKTFRRLAVETAGQNNVSLYSEVSGAHNQFVHGLTNGTSTGYFVFQLDANGRMALTFVRIVGGVAASRVMAEWAA